MNKFLRVALITAAIAFLFANPYTRTFILWLLPLGSGIDDIIEIIALICCGVFLLWWLGSKKRGN